MTTALDANPRRCFMCGAKIFECMGFVLARDILPILQATVAELPIPSIKVRELCGFCVFVWKDIIGRVS